MKQIKLTRGKFALVDDEDFEYLNQFRWHAVTTNGKLFYAYRYKKGEVSQMHRVVMNIKSGQKIDHKDGNGLNNQKDNLRFCDSSQNGANRIAYGKSKYLGVHLSILKWTNDNGEKRTSGKWVAKLTKNKKLIYLGSFEKEEDAALAYNEGAKKYHKEFAKLNIISN